MPNKLATYLSRLEGPAQHTSWLISAEVNARDVAHYINNVSGAVFYSLLLVVDGNVTVMVDGSPVACSQHDVLLVAPGRNVRVASSTAELSARLLLIGATRFRQLVDSDEKLTQAFASLTPSGMLHDTLSEGKTGELLGFCQQMDTTMAQPHQYKEEMLSFSMRLVMFFVAELMSSHQIVPTELKYKENIFRIFIHLASTHYRQERQVGYYADRIGMSPAYLSRIVKEVSGATILTHLQSYLLDEACRLLRQTDMTMGEISVVLSFKDQSAFTNFFKLHTGKSPKAYRDTAQAEI